MLGQVQPVRTVTVDLDRQAGDDASPTDRLVCVRCVRPVASLAVVPCITPCRTELSHAAGGSNFCCLRSTTGATAAVNPILIARILIAPHIHNHIRPHSHRSLHTLAACLTEGPIPSSSLQCV
jgi:hypothetical protein